MSIDKLYREYKEMIAKHEANKAHGIVDDDLLEEIEEIEKELNYRNESDRFYF